MAQLDLEALVARLATRTPGRSEATIQSDIRTLLLAAPLNLDENGIESIKLETRAGERRRIDIEAGFAVIEVKRDLTLGNVRAEAVEQLTGYVKQRSTTLGQRYVGVLTDGVEWSLYHLTREGTLCQVGQTLAVNPADPDLDALLIWLESVLATGQQIAPTPQEIEARLGAESPAHALDRADLLSLYEANRLIPSVVLKRQLWAKLLTTALGTSFRDDDALFVEHTLLVATAEVIAHAVVGYDPTQLAPATILSGALFEDAQIRGVVESDFFDWLIEVEGGEAFVRALARRVGRFNWAAVEHDVMKVLYESIIGRVERYNLGEYYTPDWLAERIVSQVVTDPLRQRVLDPGCGSGTFLFHAVRRYLDAAEVEKLSNRDAIRGATEHIVGVDIHPLAVTFARVTYLLAIGMERITAEDRPPFTVPVYLGDSLQWGREETLLTANTLTVTTGDGAQLFASELRFPDSLIADAGRFDHLVAELAQKAADRPKNSPIPSLRGTFRRFPMSDREAEMVQDTFRVMCQLHDEERDHIWSYYVRNLARPTWLAQENNRVDVLVGNPPWLTYNAIAPDLKATFRDACIERNLWGSARTRNYDLAALFVVRAIELYLKPGGRFGFVMPLAALTRRQYAGFRSGDYPIKAGGVTVQFETPWDLDAVRPHPFPVPSSVVFGSRSIEYAPRPMPSEAVLWSGKLRTRNVSWSEAETNLTRVRGGVVVAPEEHASPYSTRFESGAKLNPQVLVLVEPAPSPPLGVPAGYRAVRSIRSAQEKRPWKDVPTLEKIIEAEFLRPVHLGSTILPYRTLEPLLAVVPWDRTAKRLLDVGDDELDRYPRLAEWWREASALWNKYGTPERYQLTARVDYQRKLARQLPPPTHRVVYSASGSRLAAARLDDSPAIVQHMLYWAATSGVDEGRYLCAILNSKTVADLLVPYQSRGQFGARHIDKYVWYLPIPIFDPADPDHEALAALGARAEEIAATVELPASLSFQIARRRVREALDSDGVSAEIETRVAKLLSAGSRS